MKFVYVKHSYKTRYSNLTTRTTFGKKRYVHLRGPGTSLGVELHIRHSEPDHSREQALLHIAVLLEGHVLDHRRQLVMVADHDPPLQPGATVLRILEQQRNECLDLQDLGGLLHKDVVVFETCLI